MAAVRQNSGLWLVGETMKRDQEVVWKCLKHDSSLFEVSREVLYDKQFILQAVKCGYYRILSYVPKAVTRGKIIEKELLREAVKNNGYALKYVGKELQKDEELVMEALKCNGYVFEYSDELYQARMHYCYHDAYLGVTTINDGVKICCQKRVCIVSTTYHCHIKDLDSLPETFRFNMFPKLFLVRMNDKDDLP